MISHTLLNNLSNRAKLIEHLDLTRDQLADGEQHIAEQKQYIAQLLPGSREMFWATTFLDALEHIQAMHAAQLYRLEQELAVANSK